MASAGKAIKSVARATRANVVSPLKANFETKMKTPQVTALTPVIYTDTMLDTGSTVYRVAADPHHPWGVHWPGHVSYPTRDGAPKFDYTNFLDAFYKWEGFRFPWEVPELAG